MSKKKLKQDGIYFLGKSSEEVTGSNYLIRFGGHQILLECGMYQSSSNSYLDGYKVNSAKFQFKPSEIEYVFCPHVHCDHIGLLPRLVKEGFKGQIITTKETAEIMKPLLLNSCYIVNEEAKILSKRYSREYKPLYDECHVYETLKLISVYEDYNYTYSLNDTVKFQWLENSHCIGASQLQLILHNGEKTRKILYTSDIGALNTKNHYVKNTKIPTMFNDIVILESTYGSEKKKAKKSRKFDIQHLNTAIQTTLERKGSVIMPCFSFSRTQELLTTLYELYGNDESFKSQVVVDSKLSCEISKLYLTLLSGENLDLWKKVYNWKNLKFISEKEESKSCLADSTPKIVLSSSGFCTNGRIVNYLKKYIRDRNSMIIFSGYVGDNNSYLSYRIKNYDNNKFVSINKEKIPNNSDCMTLSTFSSHANREDLVKFGSCLNTNKLILVHGDEESKKSLAQALKEKISKSNKTFKVLISNKGMIVHL